MTKAQKNWLWVSVAMFAVPEVLWGGLLNALTSVIHVPIHSVYTDIQYFTDHPFYVYLIFFVEILFVLLSVKIIYKSEFKNKYIKIFILVVLSLLALLLLGLLYLNYMMSQVSFP